MLFILQLIDNYKLLFHNVTWKQKHGLQNSRERTKTDNRLRNLNVTKCQ